MLSLNVITSGVATGGAGAPNPAGTTHEIHANPKTFFGGGGREKVGPGRCLTESGLIIS